VLYLPLDDSSFTLGARESAKIHQLQGGQDRRQGIPELVAQHGQEFIFRPACRFCSTPGLRKFRHLKTHSGDATDAAVFEQRLIHTKSKNTAAAP
jgi:hypothetical protein